MKIKTWIARLLHRGKRRRVRRRFLGDNYRPALQPRPTAEQVAECLPIYQDVVSNGFLPYMRTATTKAHKPVVVEESDKYITFNTQRMTMVLVTAAGPDRQSLEGQWRKVCKLAEAGYRCYFGWMRLYIRLYKPQES